MSKFVSLENLDVNNCIIRCPVCGQEYLIAEIFLPEDFLGNPSNIVKRVDGKIDFYLGEKPSFETSYCCDNCNTTFDIKAKVAFETTARKDFSDEYVSKLKTNVLAKEQELF